MRVPAHAKVNLRLRVLAQERNGYHQIETLYCRVALADTIEIDVADVLELVCDDTTTGPLEKNLIWRAAQAFSERTGTTIATRIRLNKNIPAGAGLGGGSSDAATTLIALNQLHGRPLDRADLHELAGQLGSDVPFFLLDTALALGWGRGERLLPLPAPPPAPALIVVPAQRIPTAHAYARLAAARANAAPPRDHVPLDLEQLRTWDGIASIACNDFDPIGDALVPDVPAIRQALRDAGARIAMLSGSGSALFGVFEDVGMREAATHFVRDMFPDTSVLVTDASV